jgi:hypothetical protein
MVANYAGHQSHVVFQAAAGSTLAGVGGSPQLATGQAKPSGFAPGTVQPAVSGGYAFTANTLAGVATHTAAVPGSQAGIASSAGTAVGGSIAPTS